MLINFAKMHSLGNDFVVIDGITQNIKLHTSHIKRIANRKVGIGCDQVIVIEPPIKPNSDFYYRIYNSDGYEVEQCVNGARCAANFFINFKFNINNKVYADCLAGQVSFFVSEDDYVSCNLLNINSNISIHDISFIGEQEIRKIYSISIGNPHGVCVVDNLEAIDVAKLGKKISKLDIFPAGANISFLQIHNKNLASVKVYERGVGLTLSCGSAACASALVGINLGILEAKTKIKFRLGDLNIKYNEYKNLLQISGITKTSFLGKFIA